MFFYVSKIVWAVIAPLNFIFLLFVAGTSLLVFRVKAGRIFILLGVFFFALFGVSPAGPYVLSLLESSYQRPQELPERVDGILVLGGSFETDLSATYGFPVINDGVERLIDAVELARRYPMAIVVFSGGNGSLTGQGTLESTDTEQFLQQIGFPEDNVFYEDRSRNTYENILFSGRLMQPKPYETWIVITSAYHMPRAMAVFETVKWPGRLIPYPTDFHTHGKRGKPTDSFDVLGKVYQTQLALHEYAGVLGYILTGKITSPHD